MEKFCTAASLRDKIQYRLMTNHDSIEISDKIFGFATPAQREFNAVFREKAFELAIKHQVNLLFTFVCAFEDPEEKAYLKGLESLFRASGGEFYFVELSAALETRLERNETPHRMEMKPSKRNVQWSRNDLLRSTEDHRLNTYEDKVWFENHMKIDNTNLMPDEVADLVIERFGLARSEQ
ncbi:MAG: hypothetical protein HFE64_00335 [Lachnospiraceae bacterium]|nr:hypothetical protein [Lachnospiraceae bacterium]